MDTIAVIGGGPAGATIAASLALRGLDVTVYEAARFPRPHIGESLLPATIEALEFTGAADKVREASFTVKNGATMAWGVDHEPWTWYFRETNTAQPHAYQVNRDEFDQILLRHAAACGAQVREETRVESVAFDGDVARGVVINGSLLPASYVIDASGQTSLIANQFGSRRWDDQFRNLAVYCYYHGGTHLDGEAAGNILVESIADGWLWKIPLKNGISSVGVVADRDQALDGIRGNHIAAWFNDVVGSSRFTNQMLKNADPVGDCIATRDWSYIATRFAGPRHCLVGDAACFIDPLFSTGVHLAIFSAILGAALVATTLNQPELATAATTAFERQYRSQYHHFRELARLFYGSNRSIDSYFWQARQLTGETDYSPRAAFVRAVSGQTQRGYERTTLAHGALPKNFTDALANIEADRNDRRARISKLTSDAKYTLAAGAEITNAALFTGEAFEEGQVIRRSEMEDVPISPFVADVVSRLRVRAQSIDQLRSTMTRGGWRERVVNDSLAPAVELLYLDGILELVRD